MKTRQQRFLISDVIGNRFRTNLGWVKENEVFLPNEGLFSFSTREKCEDYIYQTRMINSVSYCILDGSYLFGLNYINQELNRKTK
jgi:hypothetical protein